VKQTRKLERSQETGEGVRNPGVGTVADPAETVAAMYGARARDVVEGQRNLWKPEPTAKRSASREGARDSGGARPLA